MSVKAPRKLNLSGTKRKETDQNGFYGKSQFLTSLMKILAAMCIPFYFSVPLIICIMCSSTFDAYSQITEKFIENWVSSCNQETDFSTIEKLYVLDGVPFNSDNIDDKLESFNLEQPWLIDYLFSDSVETTFLKPNMLVIILGSIPKLKKSERSEKLNELKAKFTDHEQTFVVRDGVRTDPILLLNDQLIQADRAFGVISDLAARDIQFIYYSNHSSCAIYGSLAMNGEVKIWTKDYSRNKD